MPCPTCMGGRTSYFNEHRPCPGCNGAKVISLDRYHELLGHTEAAENVKAFEQSAQLAYYNDENKAVWIVTTQASANNQEEEFA